MTTNKKKGLSLIELLVGLAIVGVVSVIIVPKFLGVKAQAQSVVAAQMQTELNNTYATWKAAGGSVSGSPAASDMLTVFTAPAGVVQAISRTPENDGVSSSYTIVDTPVSSNFRMSAPASLTVTDGNGATVPLTSATAPSSVVNAGNFVIKFEGDGFTAVQASNTPTSASATSSTSTGSSDTSSSDNSGDTSWPTPPIIDVPIVSPSPSAPPGGRVYSAP